MSEEKSEIDSSKYLSEIDRSNEKITSSIEKDKLVSIPYDLSKQPKQNKKLEVESSKHFQNVLPMTSTNPNDYDRSKEMIFEHLSYNPDAIVEELIFTPETTHFISTKKKATKKLNLSKIFSNNGITVITNFYI